MPAAPPEEASLVSVIVPAYNAAPYLGAALASALAQTHADLEVIVVDDGSTDDTAAVAADVAARDPRVRVLRQANQGVAAARNRALEAARGAFIAPLDADDLWHPDKLARQLAALRAAGPAAGLAYCGWETLDAAGRPVPGSAATPTEAGRLADVLACGNVIPCASTPLIRRAALDDVGAYDESLQAGGGQGCEDWDLYLRIAERYTFAVVPDVLLGYRAGHASMSSSPAGMLASYDAMMRRLLERRPDLPPLLVHRSRFRFYLYLLGPQSEAGHVAWTLRLLARALAHAPWLLAAKRPSRAAWRNLLRLLVRGIANGAARVRA